MGVFGRQTKAPIFSKNAKLKSTPVDPRELRRWLERHSRNLSVDALVEAACVRFGVGPTLYIFALAQDATRKARLKSYKHVTSN